MHGWSNLVNVQDLAMHGWSNLVNVQDLAMHSWYGLRDISASVHTWFESSHVLA